MSSVAGRLFCLNTIRGDDHDQKIMPSLLLTPVQVNVKSSCQTTEIAPMSVHLSLQML